eukprot:4785753-Pleurochrysis_carterae.AAC.1
MATTDSKTVWLGDAGAGMRCVAQIHCQWHDDAYSKYRCDVDRPLRTDKGDVVDMRLKNVLLLGKAYHDFISLGRLASKAHVRVRVEGTTGALYLCLPGGHVVPMLTVGVREVPASNAAVAALPAVDTRGNIASGQLIAK